MKTIVALFVALVILLPVSGNATTLTITSGSAFLNQGAVAGSGPSLILFGGNGFSVFMMREPSFFGDLSPAFSGEPFVKSMQFYSSFFGGLADVRVGTEQRSEERR